MSPRASTARRVDYRAAYIAAGLTPAQADAQQARTRRMAKRVKSGEITLERARDIFGVASLMRAGSR